MRCTLTLAFALVACSAIATPASAPVDPNKLVTVSLTFVDWKAIVSSLSDSAYVSARDAARINQSIAAQARTQLAPLQPPAPAKR